MVGTILNVVTVLVGTALGVTLGNRLSARMRETVLIGLGLSTTGYAVLNIVDAMAGQQNAPFKFIVILLSVLLGGVVGELLDLDGALNCFGAALERRFAKSEDAERTARFIRGYVAASLVFCVGPMTILGSIQDGLNGDYSLLAIKSTLDGFAALAFAASLGVGVGFSIITIVVVQGGIALLAGQLQSWFTSPMLAVLSATGALLIIGIGLTLPRPEADSVGELFARVGDRAGHGGCARRTGVARLCLAILLSSAEDQADRRAQEGELFRATGSPKSAGR
ncbi:MAG: membrane protein [Candidatus Roseilinea sp.]|nr:MAG: membrane protein [Candidatus Roseilinea sp.]